MMTAIAIFLLGLILFFAILSWRSAWVKANTRDQLWPEMAEQAGARMSTRPRRFGRKIAWVVLVFGIVSFIALSFFLPASYSFAFAFLGAIICWQILDMWKNRTVNLVEEQLADMVDLMASGLQAGAGPVAAMSSALSEIGKPIGPMMSDVMGRLQLGDSPSKVFHQLIDQTDLETFKIFGASMAVHWETGGRLVPLLNTVSKMIRDRIEVMRNARLQSAQGRLSAIVFVIVTYILAYAVWRYDPTVMSSFVNSPSGNSMMTFLIILQALGMLWIQRMTKLRY